ncbi:competence/damage-inducible protein A [Salinarchaeum laminariae]|uniref:competence/damage-inducible protein A n=1 Tax=Salinarchaeum laminariae TaxID=869888 RepID=UPI0020C00CF6|nr:molybdopterin-binding protein [Salinarchaeum laminariae]
MNVAVVTVGDELLAGDTANTNATWLCGELTDRGVDVRRVITLPDVVGDIARVVNEYRAEYDAVVITGGLGPTHDDLTMESVAAAFGREVAHDQAAEDWLVEHSGYAAADLDPGTTAIPRGADPLHNEVGVAPGCVLENVYVLPGVPTEMKAMFADVAENFSGPQRYVRQIAVDEPESHLVDRFDDLRERFDVAVGSYPGDHVRVKLSGTDRDAVDAAAAWLRERVDLLEE